MDFPYLIDNTMRDAFTLCPRRFQIGHLLNKTVQRRNVHLHAGGAMAAGLEAARKAYYEHGKSIVDAMAVGYVTATEFYGNFEPPEKSTKTRDRTALAIVDYIKRYPFDVDYLQPFTINGTPSVEFTFAVPIPNTVHPTTGDEILYGGRFDMHGVLRHSPDGKAMVVDEKTTSQLGQTWSAQWALDSQMTGYIWASRQYGYPTVGAVIRGIGFLSGSYGHAEVIVYRSDWEIERWLERLRQQVRQMIHYWDNTLETPVWPQALTKSICTSHSAPCEFTDACRSRTPDEVINSYFDRDWNPMHKDPETVLAPPEPVLEYSDEIVLPR